LGAENNEPIPEAARKVFCCLDSTISTYQRFKWLRDQLEKEGVNLALPTGN
jgi:hypothetical protein